MNLLQAISFWKRFIDNCIGIWRGTKREFDNFVRLLNREMKKFGIEFPVNEIQFGRSVQMLDLFVYLEENNIIHYKGYSKPNDSTRYLNPNSFHPRSVFNAIPFSQVLRTLRNNSKPETMSSELELCLEHFVSSGYKKERIQDLKQSVLNKTAENRNNDEEAIVFPIHHFESLDELKELVCSMDNEICSLIGVARVMFAIEK